MKFLVFTSVLILVGTIETSEAPPLPPTSAGSVTGNADDKVTQEGGGNYITFQSVYQLRERKKVQTPHRHVVNKTSSSRN